MIVENNILHRTGTGKSIKQALYFTYVQKATATVFIPQMGREGGPSE